MRGLSSCDPAFLKLCFAEPCVSMRIFSLLVLTVNLVLHVQAANFEFDCFLYREVKLPAAEI